MISYSPTPAPGPWQEYGPVFVHLHECAGREVTDELPEVHVRALREQCFAYAVR